MPQPISKRLQPIGFGHNNCDNHGSFGASNSKVIPNTMKSWGRPKDVKSDFKGSSKSATFDKHFKRERRANSKNSDSWNKAKKRLTTDEINRRRNTCTCMNNGEIGHMINDCPKPKP